MRCSDDLPRAQRTRWRYSCGEQQGGSSRNFWHRLKWTARHCLLSSGDTLVPTLVTKSTCEYACAPASAHSPIQVLIINLTVCTFTGIIPGWGHSFSVFCVVLASWWGEVFNCFGYKLFSFFYCMHGRGKVFTVLVTALYWLGFWKDFTVMVTLFFLTLWTSLGKGFRCVGYGF